MKNILVTGASGFLGRHLCRKLESMGHNVTKVSSKEADLTLENSLNQFNNHQYDWIFHLAVWVQAGDFPKKHAGDVWLQNQKINTHLLSWWKEHQSQAKLIAMGTSCAYAPGEDLVEERYLDGTPHESLLAYAMTKRMLYAGMQSLQKQYGMQYLAFAFSALYGEEYEHRGKQCHFIVDLIKKIIAAKSGGPSAVLWGDGHQKRELLYVQDLVYVMTELTPQLSNELVNVSSGVEHSIRTYAGLICQDVGYNPSNIEYDTSRYVGAKSKCLNNRKLKKLLPDYEFTPLSTGLKKMIQWYLSKEKATSIS